MNDLVVLLLSELTYSYYHDFTVFFLGLPQPKKHYMFLMVMLKEEMLN